MPSDRSLRDRVDDTPSVSPRADERKERARRHAIALLRRWVIVIGVVAIAANAGAAAYDSWRLFADVGRGEASVLTPLRADAIRVLERTLVLSLLRRRRDRGPRSAAATSRARRARSARERGALRARHGRGQRGSLRHAPRERTVVLLGEDVEIFIGASDKPITSREEWLARTRSTPTTQRRCELRTTLTSRA